MDSELLILVSPQVNVLEYALDTIEEYQRSPQGLEPLISLQVCLLTSLLRAMRQMEPSTSMKLSSRLPCRDYQITEILSHWLEAQALRDTNAWKCFSQGP